MTRVTNLENCRRIFGNIEEIENSYFSKQISGLEDLLWILNNDDFYWKFILMELILVGESSKCLQPFFKGRSQSFSDFDYRSLYNDCYRFRRFRNNIAHNYYDLDITDTLNILTDDLPRFKAHLTELSQHLNYNFNRTRQSPLS